LKEGGLPLYDTPGIYGLLPLSEDEEIARLALVHPGTSRVIVVVDAKNLRRGLALALEVAEAGRPIVIALNMEDEARALGYQIDPRLLADLLGVPVIPTVATRGEGVEALRDVLAQAALPRLRPAYPAPIAQAIEEVAALLPSDLRERRLCAISILAGERTLLGECAPSLPKETLAAFARIRKELSARLTNPLRAALASARLAEAGKLEKAAGRRDGGEFRKPFRERLGEWAMQPVTGPLILAGVLFGMYKFVGEFGAGTLVDLLEGRLFEGWLNPLVTRWLEALLGWEFLREMIVGPYGLFTMGMTYALAIILPVVGTFFLAFGVLEDSGYLPRLSLLVNRLFRAMGLNGKAVLPMVLGLGCDTMATLTTRILETPKERLLVTLLLALGIPCSAQLGVIMGLLGEASGAALLIWAGVVSGVLLTVGFLAARLLPGDPSDFIVEIPPVRIPQLSNVLLKTLARIEWYLKEAVPLFLLGTLLLFLLDKLGALVWLQGLAAPVVNGLLGLPDEAANSFLIGFLRRDYGAAGLFALAKAGKLDSAQVLVSLVTITLFIPCVANLLIIVKERGGRTALAISAFIFPFAFLVGGALRYVLGALEFTP
jgi:ferrous iron transport protein B